MPKTIKQIMAERFGPNAAWGTPVVPPATRSTTPSPSYLRTAGDDIEDMVAAVGQGPAPDVPAEGTIDFGARGTTIRRPAPAPSFGGGLTKLLVGEDPAATRAAEIQEAPGAEFAKIAESFKQKGPPKEFEEAAPSVAETLAGVTAPDMEAAPAMPADSFGKSIEERIAGARSEEDEMALLAAVAHALNSAEFTSASQLALGLEPVKRRVPGAVSDELKYRSGVRRGLEKRVATPEWDPKSEVSKLARESLSSVLGGEIPETISAGQIQEQFGSVGGLISDQRKLELARQKDARLPNETVKTLALSRSALSKLKNVDKVYNDVINKVGPIRSRLNKLAKKVGWDNPKVSLMQADLRDAFAKYLYGTSGKQLSNREIDFMAETSAQDWMNPDTFKEVLASMQRRILEEHNSLLIEHGNAGRDIQRHVLPGWSYDGQTITYKKRRAPVKIPRSDTESIDDAKKRKVEYELTD